MRDDVTPTTDAAAPSAPSVRERYLGCLLGMGIGDALGTPAACLTPAEVRARFGRIDGYRPHRDAQGDEPAAGQVGANTELALCLVEALATSNGFVDPVSAGYRFSRLLQGDYAHLLGRTTRAALERAAELGDFQAGLGGEGTAGVGPAARVAPVALAHALGRFSAELFVREVLRSALITHADPEAINGALAMGFAMDRVVRRETLPEMIVAETLAFIDEDAVARQLRVVERLLAQRAGPEDDAAALTAIGVSGYVAEAVPAALYLFAAYGDDFEGAVIMAANAGGAAGAIGAMIGALSGAWVGAANLPQRLVDGLESRMYILMAAPALLQVAQRRGGLFLQLQHRQ